MIVGVFAAGLFFSAMLLFWVQPMVARMVLPVLGGTPTVWNTCVLFFQALLMAGYGYAHVLTTRVPVRLQLALHCVLMLGAFAFLPIGLGWDAGEAPPWESHPFSWLVRSLFVAVGLPFFAISTTAPLVQSWFSRTRHPWSRDPYFLYGASNVGGMIGLLGYPLLVEPGLSVEEQTWLWGAGYVILFLLLGCCGVAAWRAAFGRREARSELPVGKETLGSPISWGRRGHWFFLAFVPSSLMLGVTTYLTTDIASVPLLWVIPLALYLLTFILAFSRRRLIPLSWLVRLMPAVAVILVFLMLAEPDNLAGLQMSVHLGFFFLAGWLCHSQLAMDRPSPAHLTEFYFCVSLGGVMGGMLNALIAPGLFDTILEYPLMIVLACAACAASVQPFPGWKELARGIGFPVGIGVLTAVLTVTVPRSTADQRLVVLVIFGVPMVLCYVLSRQPWRFALALGVVLVASHWYTASSGRTLVTDRNFFGALRITLDPDGRMYRLYHGTTIHGMQFVSENRRDEPLAYYHRMGPCGWAMDAVNGLEVKNVGIIGLGAGAMVSYARPGQSWTFFEIDPLVIDVACDSDYFDYLRRLTNVAVDFKVGDARLRLRQEPARHFDVLVCDAFGSDAPPLHLINREAMELYLSRLSSKGVMLFHVSSRYLDFEPVLARLASHFRLHGIISSQEASDEDILKEGKFGSTWVALAQRREDLGALADDPRWVPLSADPEMRLWTDDYSNITGILRWD